MVRPMPIDVLIHDVTYEEYAGEGRHGIEYKEPITLNNVLVQPVSSLSRSGNTDGVAFNSLLFFDCVNSAPQDVKFVKKSRVTFNGDAMVLDKINPIFAFNLHHYEIELI